MDDGNTHFKTFSLLESLSRRHFHHFMWKLLASLNRAWKLVLPWSKQTAQHPQKFSEDRQAQPILRAELKVEITSKYILSLSSAYGRNTSNMKHTCSNCIHQDRVLFCGRLRRFWGKPFPVLNCQSMPFLYTCSGCRSADTKKKGNKIGAWPCSSRLPLDALFFFFISSVNRSWVTCMLDCCESTCLTKHSSSPGTNLTSCHRCYRGRVHLTEFSLVIVRCHE